MTTSESNSPKAPRPVKGAEPPKVFATPTVASQPLPDRTDAIESAVDFYILGPRRKQDEPALWAVLARLLQWTTNPHGIEAPWYSRAIRQLYVDRTRPANPLPQYLLPGMLIARCRILTARISVHGHPFDYAAPSDKHIDVDLLLTCDDTCWRALSEVVINLPVPTVRLLEAVCLAGEIPFDQFGIHPNASAGQGSWTSRFPMFQDISNVALSSSGLIFDAKATTIWSKPGEPPISRARYVAEICLPADRDDAVPPLVIVPDLERIGDAAYSQARTDYFASFAQLAQYLQPNLAPVTAGTTPRLPQWSSLELTDPVKLPGFSWRMTVDRGDGKTPVNSFRFDAGAWRLALSSQPARVPGVIPSGVLSVSPHLDLSIDPNDKDRIIVTATSGGPLPKKESKSTLTYLYDPAKGKPPETIILSNVITVYDQVEVAASLRKIASLPDPDLDQVDAFVGSALLTSDAPLHHPLGRESRSADPVRRASAGRRMGSATISQRHAAIAHRQPSRAIGFTDDSRRGDDRYCHRSTLHRSGLVREQPGRTLRSELRRNPVEGCDQ